MTPSDFAAKWTGSTRTERAASQEHFIDLCRMLGGLTPNEADHTGEWYAFEKGAEKSGGGDGFADVWKRGHFGWEYKGKRKDLDAAYQQLLLYREALDNPPLLVVCDLNRFEVHTNFTGTAKKVYKFTLADLASVPQEPLRILRAVMEHPESLRPTTTRQEITEEAARQFAALAQTLRGRGHDRPVAGSSSSTSPPFTAGIRSRYRSLLGFFSTVYRFTPAFCRMSAHVAPEKLSPTSVVTPYACRILATCCATSVELNGGRHSATRQRIPLPSSEGAGGGETRLLIYAAARSNLHRAGGSTDRPPPRGVTRPKRPGGAQMPQTPASITATVRRLRASVSQILEKKGMTLKTCGTQHACLVRSGPTSECEQPVGQFSRRIQKSALPNVHRQYSHATEAAFGVATDG